MFGIFLIFVFFSFPPPSPLLIRRSTDLPPPAPSCGVRRSVLAPTPRRSRKRNRHPRVLAALPPGGHRPFPVPLRSARTSRCRIPRRTFIYLFIPPSPPSFLFLYAYFNYYYYYYYNFYLFNFFFVLFITVLKNTSHGSGEQHTTNEPRQPPRNLLIELNRFYYLSLFFFFTRFSLVPIIPFIVNSYIYSFCSILSLSLSLCFVFKAKTIHSKVQ